MKGGSGATRDPWLVVLWLALGVAGPLIVAIFIVGIPLHFRYLLISCPSICEDDRLSANAAAVWQDAGLPLALYAAIIVGVGVALALLCFTLAALLLWRRPRDRMAVFTALLFVGLGATYGNGDELVGQMAPWLLITTELLNQTGFGLFPMLLLTMPDGRFVPRWSRWVALAVLLLAMSGLSFWPWALPDLAFLILLPVWGVAGPLAQVYRYRRLADALQKQQLKWLAAGMSAGLLSFTLIVLVGVSVGMDDVRNPFGNIALTFFLHLAMSTIPLTVAIGVLRYRLWDIDVIIRRTLQYTLVTGLLLLVYFGSILFLQGVLSTLAPNQSPIAFILSTLLIVALFNPVRRRVQTVIDRRFFRQKYDAQAVLALFSERTTDELSLEALTTELTRLVQQTMHPSQVGLWLRQEGE